MAAAVEEDAKELWSVPWSLEAPASAIVCLTTARKLAED